MVKREHRTPDHSPGRGVRLYAIALRGPSRRALINASLCTQHVREANRPGVGLVHAGGGGSVHALVFRGYGHGRASCDVCRDRLQIRLPASFEASSGANTTA
jgi:hypothetical protein